MSRPFFHRLTTQRQIVTLAASESLAIYAGAGASMDRTGLSWASFSHALLEQTFDRADLSSDLLAMIGTQRLASVAVERLKSIYGEGTSDRIADIVRPILYRSNSWVSGDLVQFMYHLMIIRNVVGLRTTILTTNYDSYLEEPFEQDEVDIRINGQNVSNNPAAIGVISYLHGRVPEKGAASPIVVSEEEYARTQHRVCKEIMDVCEESDLLILGSSLTDPPLIRALVMTKDSARDQAHKRLILLPKPSNLAAETDLGRTLLRDGGSHLGCEVIYPDFYCQVAQFVAEVGTCSLDPDRYSLRVNGERYVERLNCWWRDWFAWLDLREAKVQGRHHRKLLEAVGRMADLLDAPPEERMKVELWLRWQPDERALRLWASSSGDWKDSRSARIGNIETGSKYVSVQAFCEGRPILKAVTDPAERWKTYLASPIRIWSPDSTGSHVAGAITLASTSVEKYSSVALRNSANLRRALVDMTELGESLLTPKSWTS